ncbi:MAG: KamA family radical SAM protein [Smithellaceae bacterium]|nr:KamA family radical SAM protein [Smithellaceae bacterium]
MLNGSAANEGLILSMSAPQWNDWHWQMKNRVRTSAQLARLWGADVIEGCDRVVQAYPLAVTPYYLSLVGNIDDRMDPIRRQCLPDPGEIEEPPGMQDDPLEEGKHMPIPGLVHRYHDRCLALLTSTCATHCRHCNRKRIWQDTSFELTKDRFSAMREYITGRREIREVILSGGDPLILADGQLDWILGALRAIPHVEVLRIGSRTPVVMPMRITGALCAILKKHRPLWLNTQFNHPVEITPEAKRACEMILEAGVPVSNQSVLIKGVNDNFETMRDLLHGLQRAAVRPYYLFQADQVAGTCIYHADPAVGTEIMERLWQTTTGLCLPRYVIDKPGRAGKLPL